MIRLLLLAQLGLFAQNADTRFNVDILDEPNCRAGYGVTGQPMLSGDRTRFGFCYEEKLYAIRPETETEKFLMMRLLSEMQMSESRLDAMNQLSRILTPPTKKPKSVAESGFSGSVSANDSWKSSSSSYASSNSCAVDEAGSDLGKFCGVYTGETVDHVGARLCVGVGFKAEAKNFVEGRTYTCRDGLLKAISGGKPSPKPKAAPKYMTPSGAANWDVHESWPERRADGRFRWTTIIHQGLSSAREECKGRALTFCEVVEGNPAEFAATMVEWLTDEQLVERRCSYMSSFAMTATPILDHSGRTHYCENKKIISVSRKKVKP